MLQEERRALEQASGRPSRRGRVTGNHWNCPLEKVCVLHDGLRFVVF